MFLRYGQVFLVFQQMFLGFRTSVFFSLGQVFLV